MIRFHGGPVTPVGAAAALWMGRHALVSFAHPQQAALAFECAQSVMLDNSAFTLWRDGGGDVDIQAVAEWARPWIGHPGCAGILIPDKIDGTAEDNDKMIASWLLKERMPGIPIWHMHEDLERLRYLIRCAQGRVYSSVAIGSSGNWATIGTASWWNRISQAMDVACDEHGRPLCKLHGLRMLDPDVFRRVPLSSADSCNVARNIGIDKKWSGPYAPVSSAQRAAVLAERIEHAPTASHWDRNGQIEMFKLTREDAT